MTASWGSVGPIQVETLLGSVAGLSSLPAEQFSYSLAYGVTAPSCR